MLYKEITGYDIHHNPPKVVSLITDNANHFNNDLYILSEGNHYKFDENALAALESLKKRIEKVLTNQ